MTAPGCRRAGARPPAAGQAGRRRAAALALAAAAALCASPPAFASPEAGAERGRSRSAADGRRGLLAATLGGLIGSAAMQDEAPAMVEFARKVAYPPIDRKNKKRCVWQSSSMGQSNAARADGGIFDLRECDLSGTSAASKDISGVLMNDGKFSGVDFQETVMSKAIAEGADFSNANFRNAIADRVDFRNSNFQGASFQNAVITGSNFEGADLTNADFTDAYIAMYDVKPLCKNPTMKGTNPKTGADTYESAGCFNTGLAR
ncbi:unnamed protein product [Prorocentrum cordatum]|uniref:Uncharacterized protein n=1 Tax=Prorocentrum cordatum TaxID=2364126 RepID=A0ABN9XPF7_9DINO|nr:unnamed protein product [Polarella glacialis]